MTYQGQYNKPIVDPRISKVRNEREPLVTLFYHIETPGVTSRDQSLKIVDMVDKIIMEIAMPSRPCVEWFNIMGRLPE